MSNAIAKELRSRENEVLPTARKVVTGNTRGQSVQHPSKLADNVKPIEPEMNAEDLGARKPTFKVNLNAAATYTFQSADIATTKRMDDQLDRELLLARIQLHTRKAR